MPGYKYSHPSAFPSASSRSILLSSSSYVSRLLQALCLFTFLCQTVLAAPIDARSLEARAKKDGKNEAGFNTNVSGVPVWGWAVIGASIGIVVSWALCFWYWYKPSYRSSNSTAAKMAMGAPPPAQAGPGFTF